MTRTSLAIIASLLFSTVSAQLQGLVSTCSPPNITDLQDFEVRKPVGRGKVVSVNDHGASPFHEDNTQYFQKAIDSCKNVFGGCTVVMTPAVYKFSGQTELKFVGLTDFTFDGQGATLQFSGYPLIYYSRWMWVDQVNRGQWINFNIDWDWDYYPLGTLADCLSANYSQWTFRFRDFSKFTTIDKQSFLDRLWADKDNEHIKSLHIYDEDSESVGAINTWEFFTVGAFAANVTKDVETMTITINFPNENMYSKRLPVVGKPYLVKHYEYESNGWIVQNCVHCTFTHNLYSFLGKGILIYFGSEYVAIEGTNIAPKPGSNRPISGTAEGFTVEGALGYIKIDNNQIIKHGDHCINVHQPFSYQGFKRNNVSNNAIDVTQFDMMYCRFATGDLLDFRNMDLSETGFQAKVTRVDGLTVYLNQNLPTAFGDLIPTGKMAIFVDKWQTGHVFVRNNQCGKNRASGIRMKFNQAVIYNNTLFDIMADGIYVQSGKGSAGNGEGGPLHNIIVMNNTLTNVNKVNKTAAILLAAETPPKNPTGWRDYAPFPVMHDIGIVGNYIEDTPSYGVMIYSSKRVMVEQNTFISNAWSTATTGTILVVSGESIISRNNSWGGYFRPQYKVAISPTALAKDVCLYTDTNSDLPEPPPIIVAPTEVLPEDDLGYADGMASYHKPPKGNNTQVDKSPVLPLTTDLGNIVPVKPEAPTSNGMRMVVGLLALLVLLV